ncbi:MAG: LysR family transcriptional regulator [Myxococcales bacterium]|nr:LysR family transcriptional regulator [Myxococcales bacterium]
MSETIEDLDAVRVFVRVVQAGSFTAAARRLDMPKSTVSRRVAELEEGLGARLLHRTTRKLALTDVGSVYFTRVERAIGALEDAERALTDLQDVPRGPLRVTAPIDLALNTLASMIADFQRAYPEVLVHIDASNRHVDLIAEGFDLALRAGQRLADTSLTARKLVQSSAGLFASPAYLAEHGTPESIEDLDRHAFVMLRAERFEAQQRLRGPDGEVEFVVRGALSSNDLGMMRRLVRLDSGIAVLPFIECASDVREGLLKRVLPQYQSTGGAVWAVYPSPRHLTPKVRAFIDFMAERLAAVDASLADVRSGSAPLPA